MKIINILSHIPQEVIHDYKDPQEYKKRFPDTEYVKINKSPYWVGFFKKDWHHQWGKYIKEQKPAIEMECWRPYGNIIDKPYSKDVDGILHRVFPSRTYTIKKVGSILISTPFLTALKKEIENNKVIIHFYGSHDLFITWLLLKLKPYKTPVILQHLGGAFSYFYYNYYKNPLKLIPYYFEKKALKYVTKYLTASVVEYKFLKNKFPDLDTEFFLNGVDFSEFKPIPKEEARKKLGISEEDKVILYVGRFYSTKNVDGIINAYLSLKKQDQKFRLFLVGGYKNDEFYQMAKDSGATVIERTDEPLIKYFSAADVCVMPVVHKIVKDFGGFGIAPLEVLACHTPVISDNIKHFPGTQSEREKIGKYINGNLEGSIKYILEHHEQFKMCRDIAKKYFDVISNSKKMIDIYNKLMNNTNRR